MNPETMSMCGQESLREDGMLFVRTGTIFDTMVKMPLLVASLIIVAAIMPVQSSFSSSRALDLMIYPDGSTHVFTEIDVDPLAADFELDLFGSTIDNLVVVNENGFLLTTDVLGNFALIETFGSSVITVEYDIHDLVSKQGRVWTFSLDAPSDFTLFLPKNSAIVGMTNLPVNMEIVHDQNQLTLSSGEAEINYLFGTAPIIPDPVNSVVPVPQPDYLTYAIIGGVLAVAVVGIVVFIRIKLRTIKSVLDQQTIQKTEIIDTEIIDTEIIDTEIIDTEIIDTEIIDTEIIDTEIIDTEIIDTETIDTEVIFKMKPDLREDDKEIVRFISNNGGQVLESDLRKKFLQPRTTMWRAVKRLERNGVIEIEKKDLQNLVKIRKNMEGEK